MSLEDEIKELKIKADKIGANYEFCGDNKDCIELAIFNKEQELREIKQSQNQSLNL